MPLTQTAPISEEQVRLLADLFYDKICADADLGPIFEHVVGDDWETHLAKMCDFWSSAMGGLETYLLDLCLALFGDSCDEVLDSETAGLCWLKAAHLVESRKLILFYRPGPAWLRHAA
jgi:hemoglobin